MNSKCIYCNPTKKDQYDHVRAQVKEDITTACPICNKPLIEWLRWIKTYENYKWNRIETNNTSKRGTMLIEFEKLGMKIDFWIC